MSGRCTDCGRSRTTYPIRRSGGGTYRRGGRSYRSSICGECAVERLPYVSFHAGAHSGGYDGRTLEQIVASLGTLDAAEALDSWRQRREHRSWPKDLLANV